MKKLLFIFEFLTCSVFSIAQPTQCVADALQAIEDQGGLLVGTGYEWIASGDDHIQIFGGTDGVYNTETYKNGNLIDPSGLEGLLVAGDLIRVDGVSIGLDGAASFSETLGYLCPDWGLGADDDLAVVSTLPVSWLNPLSAREKDNRIEISFSTAQQINNSHFEIEGSLDGINFNKIGKIEAEGTTTTVNHYSFIDEKPLNGVNYYRVKQVDYDGTYDYSNVASITFESNETLIYPNPSRYLINIQSANHQKIVIFNRLGEIVRKVLVEKGDNRIDISELPSGMYYLDIGEKTVLLVKE